MPFRVAIVYHSERGHTAALAEAVRDGVERVRDAVADLMDVSSVVWRQLQQADALIFGCPTYMGGVSAQFKAFMDQSSHRAWATTLWKDKIAAGFTNSSAMSGDKLNTLVQLAIFAAQHDMIWVGLGLRPGNTTHRGSADELNRLGSHLGFERKLVHDKRQGLRSTLLKRWKRLGWCGSPRAGRWLRCVRVRPNHKRALHAVTIQDGTTGDVHQVAGEPRFQSLEDNHIAAHSLIDPRWLHNQLHTSVADSA